MKIGIVEMIYENKVYVIFEDESRKAYINPGFKIKENDEQTSSYNDIIILGKKVQRINIYPENTVELKMKFEQIYKERKNTMIKLPNIDVELLVAFNNKEEDDELQYKPIFIIHFNNMYYSSG